MPRGLKFNDDQQLPRVGRTSHASKTEEQPMRRFVAAGILLLSCSSVQIQARQAAPPDWENPRVFAIGREPMHATFVPYPAEAAARGGALAYTPGGPPAPASPFVQSLNGLWKFNWVKEPSAR